ncbi:hypothetical protein PFICI_08279 [Pestalotiopsis fici W106-1]|uniref:Uncharacterized protein n=1 Tax=Pestalotiopsis fici (strain W106-1 / CGMCC3.15140) TaxID=1229662 RepID=W3X3X3_PESFW|nr:uncharacterized protein PFICI_08279 [Pestalotiopsis fici W106-1]ETS80750.1 hypothetical protein PFICI_08279 [Pestalotiopsis fici W106-1]
MMAKMKMMQMNICKTSWTVTLDGDDDSGVYVNDQEVEEEEDDEEEEESIDAELSDHNVIPSVYIKAQDPFQERSIHGEDDARQYRDSFRNELRSIIDEYRKVLRIPFHDFCAIDREDRTMCPDVYQLLQISGADWLVNFLMDAIPLPVQELLGNSETSMDEFLAHLPRFPAFEQRISCYVDLAQHQRTGEVRRYVGSATEKIGGWSRMQQYLKQSGQSLEECRETGEHQKWICNEDVEPNLFVLALFDNDARHKPFTLLLEGIFMIMFGSLRKRTGRCYSTCNLGFL